MAYRHNEQILVQAVYDPNGASTYSLSVSASSGGTIAPNGTVTVCSGGNATFYITPNSGYHLADLQLNGTSVMGSVSNNQYTINNVNSNATLYASFSNQYTITASAGSNGSISPSGAVNYPRRQPNLHYNTQHRLPQQVIVDGTSQGSNQQLHIHNVHANHTIAAAFSLIPYTITSSAGSNGSISPLGSTTVYYVGSQTYTITPNTGYVILAVTVDGTSQGAISSYTFSNVTANHTIAATFTIQQFLISASAGPNGSISPSGPVSVNYNGNQTFTFAPNTGYSVVNVVVDGTSQGAISSYAFTNVQAPHTISVTFNVTQHMITSFAGPNGSISPSGTTYAQGGSQTFTITPNTDYHSNVTVDGTPQGTISSYTFTNVQAEHTITATFRIWWSLLVQSSNTNQGTVSSNPANGYVRNGTLVTIDATPAATGYHFSYWYFPGCGNDPNQHETFHMQSD